MDIKKILHRIAEKKKQLDALRPLPTVVLRQLRKYLSLEWTYNSNAIEGNTLTLQETRLVLEEGMTIKGKSLREHFEIKNHEEAIVYLEGLIQEESPISEQMLLDLHALVLQHIEKDFAGRYRNGQVRIMGANFIPPNALKVPDMVTSLLEMLQQNPEQEDDIVLATRFHHKFVWIHPFFDGNGRTARLMTNLFLMKKGYPPAVLLKNDRKKYYDALNKANKGDLTKLTLLMAQAVERSLDMYLESASTQEEEEYMPLSTLAKHTPYSAEYLGLLARQGKIDAYKRGRNWLSNQRAVEEYRKQE